MSLYQDIVNIIGEYIGTYELRKWIDINKIDWDWLSTNPNAIDLLKTNQNKIDWFWLSKNPNAIDLLKANPEKIDWKWLSKNPNAIDLLKLNQDKIVWVYLSENPSIFKYKPRKIDCALFEL